VTSCRFSLFCVSISRVQAPYDILRSEMAMANKRAKQKKPKQQNKGAGSKSGAMSFEDLGSPKPTKKKKKS